MMNTMRTHRTALTFALSLALAACGDNGTDPKTPTLAEVTVAGSADLEVGESATFSAAAKDAAGKAISARFTWSSSNAQVAAVDSTGRVTALAEGNAMIRASASGKTGEAPLAVNAGAVVVLSHQTVTLAAIGDSVVVTGSVNGAPVRVAPSVVSEVRWNQERAVARVRTPTIHSAGVYALGVGTARVEVRSLDTPARPDTITVTVNAAAPYVVSAAADLNGLILQGHGLENVGAHLFQAPEAALAVERLDSASVRVRFADAMAAACASHMQVVTIDSLPLPLDGRGVPYVYEIPRGRADELDIPVGEIVRLSAANLGCLTLPADTTTIYALAYFDSTYAAMTPAQIRALPDRIDDYDGTIRIYDPFGVGASTSSLRAQARPRAETMEPHVTLVGERASASMRLSSTNTPPEWYEMTEKVKAGDRVNGQDYPLEVAFTLGPADYFAVAVHPDTLAFFRQRDEARMRKLLQEFLDQRGWLGDFFGGHPAHLENGQMLVEVHSCNTSDCITGSAGAYSFRIGITPNENESATRGTIVHEMAHAYDVGVFQVRHYAEYGAWIENSWWNREGAADFISAIHTVRRLGYVFDQNAATDVDKTFLLSAYNRQLEFGYGDVAALFLYLAERYRKTSGVPPIDALEAVLQVGLQDRRGCMHDNNTWTWSCDQLQGVYDFIEEELGSSVTSMVLQMMLAGAADDLTDNQALQIADRWRVWDSRLGDGEAPWIEMREPRDADVEKMLLGGGANVMRVHADRGATLRITQSRGGLAWALVRMRKPD